MIILLHILGLTKTIKVFLKLINSSKLELSLNSVG